MSSVDCQENKTLWHAVGWEHAWILKGTEKEFFYRESTKEVMFLKRDKLKIPC